MHHPNNQTLPLYHSLHPMTNPRLYRGNNQDTSPMQFNSYVKKKPKYTKCICSRHLLSGFERIPIIFPRPVLAHSHFNYPSTESHTNKLLQHQARSIGVLHVTVC